MTSRTLISTPTAIRQHLQSILPHLRRSTCLILSSQPPLTSPNNNKISPPLPELSTSIEKTIYTLTLQHNLKCLQSTLSSAFITPTDITTSLQLLKRSDARTVIGVGSGPAIDLAKTVWRESEKEEMELLLFPKTFGACLASMSEESMLLSTEEAMLLPSSSTSNRDGCGGGTVFLEEDGIVSVPFRCEGLQQFDVATLPDAILASLAIAFDAQAAELSSPNEDVEQCVRDARLALDSLDNATTNTAVDVKDDVSQVQRFAIQAVLRAGTLLGFRNRRSLPVALSSALLPRFFPRGNLLVFWASLLPGLCAALEVQNGGENLSEWADAMCRKWNVPSTSALMEDGGAAPDVEEMLDQLDANRMLLNCKEDGHLMEDVLRRSLER